MISMIISMINFLYANLNMSKSLKFQTVQVVVNMALSFPVKLQKGTLETSTYTSLSM